MSPYVKPKYCTSRHPSRDGVICQRTYEHPDSHRAEIGPPLKVTLDDGSVVTRAQVVSW
jgi:hypothetical protein